MSWSTYFWGAEVVLKQERTESQERDVATLRVLGIFFLIMGGLVLVASYQAIGNTPALVVNVCSAVVLLSVGAGMKWVSKRIAK